MGKAHQPGPGLFPFAGGALLWLLSLINLIRAFLSKGYETEDSEKFGLPKKWKNIVIALAVLFAYPFLLPIIGFAPTTFLLFVVLLRFIQPLPWPTVIKVAAVVVILTYLIFQLWLKIQFPEGIFGV